MSPILKISSHDEEKELDFEIEWQLSLSFEERFRMMLQASRLIMKSLVDNGHRKPFEIIKRE